MSKELPIEYCCECDEPTGCAGRADDSHYNEDGEGPFCWKCWCIDENPRLHEQIEQLQDENEKLVEHIEIAIDALQAPVNNTAVIETIWMPDMQAITVVEYLSSVLP